MRLRIKYTALVAGCCTLLGLLLLTRVLGTLPRQSHYSAHGRTVQVGHNAKPPRPTPKPAPPPFTFPDGGRQLMPNFRLIALYGEPGEPALGALGEQSLNDTLSRIKTLAATYQPLSAQPILPALEIIATVASASPTANNDYSQEIDPATLQPWIEAARTAGVYVVLDLQSGRADFLSQAKEYASLLAQPNVGLALDPEWRLTADQLPLAQIGSVGIDEVNATASWLADLVAANNLPQKLLVLHEFRPSMLPGRAQLDTSRTSLAYVIQMDGQGAQQTKQSTWQTVTSTPPANIYFGWKNFYLKDSPMLTPDQTMQIAPQPWYVSYQ